MTSKNELKRRATTVNPTDKLRGLEKERDLLRQALSNLVNDCDVWKLSMSEVLGTDSIGWDSLDVAKELIKASGKETK